MALISTEYVSTALGEELSTADTARVAQLVDEISEYIIDYTGNFYDDPNYYPRGVPKVVQGLACRAVLRGLNSDLTNFSTLTVGDITEVYNGLLDFPPADQKILDQEGGGRGTYYLDCGSNSCGCGSRVGIAVSLPFEGDCGC